MIAGVVDAVRITQQGSRQGAQLKELVPFATTTRQPGHLDPQHDPHVIQTDFGNQALEAGPGIDPGRGMPQVLVDHQHPRRRPPQRNGAFHQRVLQPRGLLMVPDLPSSRLAHIHSREPVTMPGLNLALQPFPRQSDHCHRPHPRPRTWAVPPSPSAPPAAPVTAAPPPGSPPGRIPTSGHPLSRARTGGHSRVSSSHRDLPPSPASTCPPRSLRTVPTSANRASTPMTGAFPVLVSSMSALRLAP
jgi:hypothetical protein